MSKLTKLSLAIVLVAKLLILFKALEIFALASIAPNKIKYQEYRAQADKNPDYTKDSLYTTKIDNSLK